MWIAIVTKFQQGGAKLKISYKKTLFTISGIICFAGITACGQSQNHPAPTGIETGKTLQPVDISDQDLRELEAPTPTPLPVPAKTTLTPKATPTIITTPTPTIAVPNSSPVPTPPLDPTISYWKTTLEKNRPVDYFNEEIAVYFSEEATRQQVIVCVNENYYIFDWNYHLDYGDPIVYLRSWDKEYDHYEIPYENVLAIWLPTAECTELLTPDGAREICGEGYLLPIDDMLAGVSQDTIQEVFIDAAKYAETFDKLITGVVQDMYGTKTFSLFSSDGRKLKKYPELSLPKSDYPVVHEDVLHISETKRIFQRVGIKIEEDIVWLGKYEDGELNLEFGYDAKYSQYMQEWWPRILDNESFIDLDGDGTLEKVSYRVEQDNSSFYDYKVLVDGKEYTLVSNRDNFITPLLTASLDGKTNQLIVIDYGEGLTKDFLVFSYREGKLQEAGCFQEAEFRAEELDGKQTYRSVRHCHMFQHDFVSVNQEFVNGMLKQIPQDYYEFLPLNNSHFELSQGRNVILLKTDLEWYQEKEGTTTYLLPAGSRIITLGTDFKGWILVENQDTKEQGWLHVVMDEGYSAAYILSYGEEVYCWDVFEGLNVYD